jgi:hypothetical protein
MDPDICLYDRFSEKLIDDPNLRPFLPRGEFEKLMNPRNIEAELFRTGCITTAHSEIELRDLVNFIRNQAKICFATLVFIKKVSEIITFRQNGLTDKHLPLAFEFTEGKCDAKVLHGDSGFPNVQPLTRCFKPPWDRQDREAFAEKQWLFLAPVFTEEDWKHTFHDKCPLPFLQPGAEQIARRTLFSEVRQWEIHSDHIIGVSKSQFPLIH